MRGRDGTERIVQPDGYDAPSLHVPGLISTRFVGEHDHLGPRNVVMWGGGETR